MNYAPPPHYAVTIEPNGRWLVVLVNEDWQKYPIAEGRTEEKFQLMEKAREQAMHAIEAHKLQEKERLENARNAERFTVPA